MTPIPDPTELTEVNRWTSEGCTLHFVTALLRGEPFCPADHATVMTAEKEAAMGHKDTVTKTRLDQVCGSMEPTEENKVGQGGLTRAGLSVMPTHVNGTALGCREWWDALLSRYAYLPADLPETCGRCGAEYPPQHALSCKVGGLVHVHRGKVVGELGHHAWLDRSPYKVCSEPKITQWCVQRGKGGSTGGMRCHQGHRPILHGPMRLWGKGVEQRANVLVGEMAVQVKEDPGDEDDNNVHADLLIHGQFFVARSNRVM